MAFIYALMLCGSLQGPCSMVQGPYQTAAECQARLEQFAKSAHQPIVNGVLEAENDYFMCMKRPVSEWTPAG